MKKILLLLALAILFTLLISCTDKTEYNSQINDSNTSSELLSNNEKEIEDVLQQSKKEYNGKVSDELKNQLESISDEDYISITVNLKTPNHGSSYDVSEGYIKTQATNRTVIFERNLKILNENEDVPLTFKDLTGKQFMEASQITDDIYSEQEFESMIESYNSVEEIYEMYESTKNMHLYRQNVKEINQARNKEFSNMLDTEQCKNIYDESLLTNVTLECKKSYILEIQEISIVTSIRYNDPNKIFVPDTIE